MAKAGTKRAKAETAKAGEAVTAERLRELLSYDQTTGVFTHKAAHGRARVGQSTGTSRPSGYIEINVLGRVYKAHRLAWLHTYGRWPTHHLDHINGERGDNRIANLRECSVGQNMQNKAKYRTNTSGHTGVCWHHPNRAWVARISEGGRKRCLGYFKDKASAAAAYLAAKAKLHSFQPMPRG